MDSIYNVIDFPENLLKGMKVEGLLISPTDKSVGIAALTGRYEGQHLLRLYQMYNEEGEDYFPTHELQAFTFPTYKDLKHFMDSLPNLSAIDFLMGMNPLPDYQH